MSFTSITLRTQKGLVACRYYEGPPTRKAVVWFGEVGLGWDSPAGGLYSRLSLELLEEGISSLHVKSGESKPPDVAVFDALAGISFLEGEGFNKIAVVGHSLAGAVVIRAAAHSSSVRTVVTLATQSHGAGKDVADLPSTCSILLIHGAEDTIAPAEASERLYGTAHQPKKIIILPGNGHLLEESAAEVRVILKDWIIGQLTGRKRPKQAI